MSLYEDYEEDPNELNSFGCPLWAEEDLESIINWMKEDIFIYVDNNGFHFNEPKVGNFKRKIMPRFGIYSVLLRNIDTFIYDDPVLNKRLGKTACTNGLNIFFNLDFYKFLYKAENSPNNKDKRMGIVPILLHEVNHILEYDVIRLKHIDPKLANIVQDMYGNAYLKKAFHNIKWLPELLDMGLGLKKGDEYYASQRPEKILAEVYDKFENNRVPEMTDEMEKLFYSEKLLPEERGRTIDLLNSDILDKKNENEDHVKTIKEVINALKEAKLDHVLEKMGLSLELNNQKEIDKIEKIRQDLFKNAIPINICIFDAINFPCGQ